MTTSSPDLVSLGLASLALAALDPGPGPAGEAGGRRRGAGAASPSWPLRPGSGAAVWQPACAAGAAGTTSRCCRCPARYATAAETEPVDTERKKTGREQGRGGRQERQGSNRKEERRDDYNSLQQLSRLLTDLRLCLRFGTFAKSRLLKKRKKTRIRKKKSQFRV